MKLRGKTIFYTQGYDSTGRYYLMQIYKGVPICGKKHVL